MSSDLERAVLEVQTAAREPGTPGLHAALRALETAALPVVARARRAKVRLTKQEAFDLSIGKGEVPRKLRPFLLEEARPAPKSGA